MKTIGQIGGVLLFTAAIVMLTLLFNKVFNVVETVPVALQLDSLEIEHQALKIKYDSLESILKQSDEYYSDLIQSNNSYVNLINQKIKAYEKRILDVGILTNVQLMDSITAYYRRGYCID